MGQRQITPRRRRLHQRGHELARIILIRDAVQHADQHDRDGLAEVQGAGRRGQDRPDVAQVGVDVVGRAPRMAGQQRPGVDEHDRVVVDVDHAGGLRTPAVTDGSAAMNFSARSRSAAKLSFPPSQ
jgi:hypothetical protein